jgi:hypothetical protein
MIYVSFLTTHGDVKLSHVIRRCTWSLCIPVSRYFKSRTKARHTFALDNLKPGTEADRASRVLHFSVDEGT